MSTYARLNSAQRLSAWAVLYVLLVNLLAPVGLLIPVQNAAAASTTSGPTAGFLLLCTPYGNQIVSYDDLDGGPKPTATDDCPASVLHHLLNTFAGPEGPGILLVVSHARVERTPHTQHRRPTSAWRLGFAARAPPGL